MICSQHATPTVVQIQKLALHTALSGQTQSVLCVLLRSSQQTEQSPWKQEWRGGPYIKLTFGEQGVAYKVSMDTYVQLCSFGMSYSVISNNIYLTTFNES